MFAGVDTSSAGNGERHDRGKQARKRRHDEDRNIVCVEHSRDHHTTREWGRDDYFRASPEHGRGRTSDSRSAGALLSEICILIAPRECAKRGTHKPSCPHIQRPLSLPCSGLCMNRLFLSDKYLETECRHFLQDVQAATRASGPGKDALAAVQRPVSPPRERPSFFSAPLQPAEPSGVPLSSCLFMILSTKSMSEACSIPHAARTQIHPA